MRTRTFGFNSRRLTLLLACFVVLPSYAQDETPFTRLFDTGVVSVQPLPDEAVAKRAGWTLVPEDKVDHPFSGDAVLLNDKVAVVLRKQGRGTEVYSRAASGLKYRASVRHDSIGALKIVENSSSAVMVQAAAQDKASAALSFRLTTGEPILEIRAGEGAESVGVQSQARYVVVPDYFGDDVVFETGTPSPPPGERAGVRGRFYLPAENFILNLLDGGDAILMTVWQSSEQDVWLAAGRSAGVPTRGMLQTTGRPVGEDTRAPVDGSKNAVLHQIRCLKGKSIWLAFLEAPGLCHTGNASVKDDWKPPFPAKWRCSLLRDNGVANSWDLERGPAHETRPLIVYPIDRSTATPLTATCPTDVMRNTLGVGPCQYILACEGLAAQGDPTPNSVMTWVEKQFEGKKEKKAAEDIQERLQTMTEHVAHARTRIQSYGDFAGRVRKLLADSPGSEPFRPMVDDLDRCVAAGLSPAGSPERAKQLATEVSALIGQPNALAACRRLGVQLRALGAVQDGTLARCRMAVRRLKQQGRTDAVNQPQKASLAQEVQRLAEQMLRGKPSVFGKDGEVKP